uniref:DUF4817 domain-containing protein n=1 Tax=Strongyloides papillosus TaxID=174720 RepID=A0A0N5B9H6_STREA
MSADINPNDESLLDDDGVVNPNNSITNEKEDGNKSPKLPKLPSTTEYCKHGSYKKAKEEYAKEFPDRPVPCNRTILRLYKKLRFNACAENKQYIRKAPVTGNEEIIKKTLKVIKDTENSEMRI